MYIFQFWKNWLPIYKRLWYFIALIFVVALLYAVVSFTRQPGPVYSWQQLQDLQRHEIPIYNVEISNIDLPVQTENFVIFERWIGNTMELNMVYLDIYSFLFITALVILLSIVSAIPRFWFLAATGTAIFMVSSFQLASLRIWGFSDNVPTIIAIILLIGPCIYFQFLDKNAFFIKRLTASAVAMIAFVAIVTLYAEVSQPLRHFAANTIPASLVLVLIFIILVAHEIMAAFVTLVGKGSRNTKSTQHYFIISVIYLINLWLIYLDRINYIDWDFTLSPILLLVISGTLAIWGIRQREPLYDKIIPADPYGVYFIAALGILSMGFVGFAISSSNDIILLSLNDLIIYAHIGYGSIFLLYVIANFLPMLQANYQVFRVLYKPTSMPYFSYRLGGLIFTLAFIFYKSWMVPVNHFISGYNTVMGDLYVSKENYTDAERYYRRAHVVSPYNQHASTVLAGLDPMLRKSYLKDANSFRPTEFTMLGYAYSPSTSIEQLAILREANQIIPESGIIKNNLGLAFSNIGLADSAYRYFKASQKYSNVKSAAEMNLLGLLALNDVNLSVDSLQSLANSDDVRIKANAVSIANQSGIEIIIDINIPKDSILNLFSAALIGNYITNHINRPDTSFLQACVSIARSEKNKPYKDIIMIPAAKAFYAAGKVNRAFELQQEIVFTSTNKDLHNTTMALWALDHGKPDVAMTYLQYVQTKRIPQTSVVNAVAVSETGLINEAIIAWDSIRTSKDSLVRTLAVSMTRVFAGAPSWYSGFTDQEKYFYLKYRVGISDSTVFNALLGQIKNEDFRARAILDRSERLFNKDEISGAARVYSKLQGLHLTDMEVFSKIKFFELRLFAAQNYWTLVDDQIKKGVLFGPYHETERVFFSAFHALNTGDSATARRDFDWLSRNNYYFDEGVVLSAAYFTKYGKNPRRSYAILSEALQVNPKSVKILKSYAITARENGYDDYSASALNTLSSLMSPASFRRYVAENQLAGLLKQ